MPFSESNWTNMSGVYEDIHQPLYDTSEFAAATVQMLFFQRPIGQSLPITVAVPKSYLHTNLRSAGQLDANEFFKLMAFRFLIEEELGVAAGDTATAIAAVFLGSAFTFRKQNKNYMESPLILAGAGAGLNVVTAGAAATNEAAQSGSNSNRGFWLLAVPIYIGEKESFGVTVDLPTALAGLASTHPLKCVQDGILRRPVQ